MQQGPNYYAGQPPQPPPYEAGVYTNNNIEGQGFFASPASFSDVKIRHAFIKKAYSIVSFQLLITIGISAIIRFIPKVSSFFVYNPWLLWLALIGTIVIMFTLVCCESVCRSYPTNMILLLVFTVLESLLIGCICIQYKMDTLLIAVVITFAIVVGLTLFAFQTKIDFTGFGVYLFVFGLVLMLFGLISIILRSNLLNILYAAFGAGLFSMYLVFDTQLMIGGKHKYSISPEDYVFASLNIYLDIINLFLLILRLVSASKD